MKAQSMKHSTKPIGPQIKVRLPQELLDEIKRKAKKQKVHYYELIRKALVDTLGPK